MKKMRLAVVFVALMAGGCAKEYKYGEAGAKGMDGNIGGTGESSKTYSQTFTVPQGDWQLVNNFEQREVRLSLPMLTEDIYEKAIVQTYKLEEKDSVFYERSLPILNFYPDYSWLIYRVEIGEVILMYDEGNSYTKLPIGDTAWFKIVIGGMGL